MELLWLKVAVAVLVVLVVVGTVIVLCSLFLLIQVVILLQFVDAYWHRQLFLLVLQLQGVADVNGDYY